MTEPKLEDYGLKKGDLVTVNGTDAVYKVQYLAFRKDRLCLLLTRPGVQIYQHSGRNIPVEEIEQRVTKVASVYLTPEEVTRVIEWGWHIKDQGLEDTTDLVARLRESLT